tara:strand:+ start:647 stop:754 length:108 start_codon:yes stop_codon:yes gene_type:complete
MKNDRTVPVPTSSKVETSALIVLSLLDDVANLSPA